MMLRPVSSSSKMKNSISPIPHLLLPLMLLFTFFSDLAHAAKVTNPKNPPKNAILLSKVESLTFRANKMTTARRVSAVPQLTCAGPSNVCVLYPIDMMRCTNEGADYEAENIQWACKASLPDEFKLGSTEVMCEGYASSEDPFILKGSCGVEYRLLLTDKGEERYGRQDDDYSWNEGSSGQTLIGRLVFFAIFGTVLIVIISKLLAACRRNPPQLGGGAGGRGGGPWFGGGGDDDSTDPPPPYDSHRFNQSRKAASSRSANASSSRAGQQQNQNQGWRPGPWTAGLAGAGLGYALGRNQGGRETREVPRQGGGLFGGGGRPARAPAPSSPSASSPSFSSSRYESTGFGGTSRR